VAACTQVFQFQIPFGAWIFVRFSVRRPGFCCGRGLALIYLAIQRCCRRSMAYSRMQLNFIRRDFRFLWRRVWDVAPYSLFEIDRLLRGAYCLHPHLYNFTCLGTWLSKLLCLRTKCWEDSLYLWDLNWQGWRKLCKKEDHNMYYLSSVIKLIKFRRMMDRITRIGETVNECKW
jgi:hypothetical protein